METGSGISPRERSVLQSGKLEEWTRLSHLTSDMMLQNLEYTLKGINIDLVWYSFIIHEFIHSFWKGYVYSVPLYIAILSFVFLILQGVTIKRLP